MSCGIYKAKNKLNGKVYIGQSIYINRRWQDHKEDYSNGTSKFYKAIQEFGWDNFEWSVIEECSEEKLNDREKYWIDYYDSINNGYNTIYGNPFERKKYSKLSDERHDELIQDLLSTSTSIKDLSDKYNLGLSYVYEINQGHESRRKEDLKYPLRKLENHFKGIRDYNELTDKEIEDILFDLKENKLQYEEMMVKYGVSYKFLRRVNKGEKILKEGLDYPLRPILSKISEEEAEQIRLLLKNSDLSYEEIANIFDKKVERIRKINIGAIFKNSNYEYPIRGKKRYLTKEQLNEIIELLKNSSLTFTEIANKFNVSPTAIYYINNGESYHNNNIIYPYRK